MKTKTKEGKNDKRRAVLKTITSGVVKTIPKGGNKNDSKGSNENDSKGGNENDNKGGNENDNKRLMKTITKDDSKGVIQAITTWVMKTTSKGKLQP